MDEPNPLVAYHVGDPKSPAYEGFRFVDSRRLPAAVIDDAQLAGLEAAHMRLNRICREHGFRFHAEAFAYLREQAETADAAREWPVVDTTEWTVHSDQTLTGAAVAEMLGVADEWRTVLDVPAGAELSLEQVKRLANVAFTRSYLESVNDQLDDLFGVERGPRPTLVDAARVLDEEARDHEQEQAPLPEPTDPADRERAVAFLAAVRNCIYDEHPAGCSFGGMTVGSLYWLVAEGCALPHSDTCAWCPAEATTGFAGREPGHHDDNHRFLVPACRPCAEEWTRIDPRWKDGGGHA